MTTIQTPSLVAKRFELVENIQKLPPEIQLYILSRLSDDKIINFCFINPSTIDNICLSSYFMNLKGYNLKQQNIFKLKLINKCTPFNASRITRNKCKEIRKQLENELKTDKIFMTNYNNIINNIKTIQHIKRDKIKPSKIIDTLIGTLHIEFNSSLKKRVDLSYFINLKSNWRRF